VIRLLRAWVASFRRPEGQPGGEPSLRQRTFDQAIVVSRLPFYAAQPGRARGTADLPDRPTAEEAG
jgi:hypothetical protein